MRLLALALVLSLAAPALARPERARAIERIADGQRRDGHFEQALASYRDAWLAHDAPRYLYRLGQCEWELGHTGRALFFFDAYLSKKAIPPFQKKVEKLVVEAKTKLGQERAARAKSRVALLPIEGLPSEKAEKLTEQTHAALAAVTAERLRGLDETYADLHLASLVGVECRVDDPPCLRRLLPLIGVDVLVTARPAGSTLILDQVTDGAQRAKPATIEIEKLNAQLPPWAVQALDNAPGQ